MTVITGRFLIVIGCVVAIIVGGFLIEVLLSLQSGWLFGHTQTGHVVGWIGLAFILTVFVYPIKKRDGRESGWPNGWFMVHQAAGIVGPLLILIHAGPHFHALVPILALLAMIIVVLSGVIGVAVHRKALRLLNAARSELLSQGLSHEDAEDRLYDLASGEETFRIWQMIHTPVVAMFLVLVIAHVLGALYFGGV
jgi:cytochrome b561